MSVSISGTGVITAIGRGPNALHDALCAGKSGLAPLAGFRHEQFRATSAYEIDDRPVPGEDIPGRASRILIDVVHQALADAGLGTSLAGVPVIVGTGLREHRSMELWWRDGVAMESSQLDFGKAIRDEFGADQVITLANACSASLYALALGSDLIETGEADCVVVAGVDVLTESMHGLLERVHPLPPDRVRPFDKDRRGVLMGDGAAAIVLELDPQYTPRAVLRSVAINCDAGHVTAPDPDGIATAIRDAHARAGIDPEDVELLMVHGTGTLLNDEVEAQALRRVFDERVGTVPMTAIKSMTGHTSGASGLIGLVVAISCMERGIIPATLGLESVTEDAAGFNLVSGTSLRRATSLSQVEAFGFGGVNAVAIVEAALT